MTPEARVAGHATGQRGLSAAQERAFERHARRFGHDLGRLCGDAELVSYPVVPSVAAVRALSAATPGQRRRRQQVFFNPAIALRRSIGQGVHDRLEAAAFADGTIDPADQVRAGFHFPFPTRVLSVRHRDVRSGESWDLSVRGGRWSLDDRDDIISVVNVGSLRLEPGATVLVRGNLLVLIIQLLTCEPAGPGACQLAILPTPFSVDSNTGPLHGPGGLAGRGGAGGAVGAAAPTAQTWLGARLPGQVRVLAHPSGGGRGGAGGHGGDGGQVGRGGAHAPGPGADGVSRPLPGGCPGVPGADGLPGRDGRARPAPPVFVNERAVEPMPASTQIPPQDAVRSLDTRRGAVFTSTTQGEGQ